MSFFLLPQQCNTTLCVIIDKIGDELYEAEFYEEFPEETTIEVDLQHIIVQLLREFSFLHDNEKNNNGDDEEEEETTGDTVESPNNNAPHLKSNYFKKQLCLMAGEIGLVKRSNNDSKDYMSEVTARLFMHPTLKGVSDTIEKIGCVQNENEWGKMLHNIRKTW